MENIRGLDCQHSIIWLHILRLSQHLFDIYATKLLICPKRFNANEEI